MPQNNEQNIFKSKKNKCIATTREKEKPKFKGLGKSASIAEMNFLLERPAFQFSSNSCPSLLLTLPHPQTFTYFC